MINSLIVKSPLYSWRLNPAYASSKQILQQFSVFIVAFVSSMLNILLMFCNILRGGVIPFGKSYSKTGNNGKRQGKKTKHRNIKKQCRVRISKKVLEIEIKLHTYSFQVY